MKHTVFGMLRRVARVKIDVSEERVALIITVNKNRRDKNNVSGK
jgi:hypothetical protein